MSLPLALVACSEQHAGEAASRDLSAERWAEACEDWDEWDKPGPPFRVHGNTYYVGTCGIAAVLIAGEEGHVLIDGGTAEGAALIAANIEALGFDLEDVEFLLHSHEHFDHVAGLAELQRRSGARLIASKAAAPVLSTGEDAPSDPQYGMHEPFPAAEVSAVVENGETVRQGGLELTAIATPGHAAGALSWRWESCAEEGCETIVYADSLSPVSSDDYRFSDHPAYVEAYEAGLDRLAASPCTILLTPHPSASGMRTKIEGGEGLRDEAACARYAERVRTRLRVRLAQENEPAGD
ncbi:subclass B3 metallo-beta-lactamase [Parvularcula maris]|uniref:Subclass B3 metallo-beta-lactamase n=1 Tax=Parvularcula maris TaxID=2965077 RepID=A0A9X2L6Y5_9PROT|nr:subclass B3 metallo-beta-lactamase [Parvularcula maris]MCQ8184175.1 subclass B3 metallo-beta-lactamase [Parvularcula maris]